MKISTETKLCISIASAPGNFGMHFHNTSYKLLNLDWIYIARKVKNFTDLKNVINGMRALDIKGCSVSMPYKKVVMQFLDEIDDHAKKIGAVNTIKHKNNKILKGYNTDFYGAKKALQKINLTGKNIILIGAGGAAGAIGLAVKELGGHLTIATRDFERGKELSKKLNAKTITLEQVRNSSGYLLINATPVGMKNTNEVIVEKDVIKNYDAIMDIVMYPAKTKLLKLATNLGKEIIPGTLMCVHQAAEQFKIYTGIDAPEKVINNTLMELNK